MVVIPPSSKVLEKELIAIIRWTVTLGLHNLLELCTRWSITCSDWQALLEAPQPVPLLARWALLVAIIRGLTAGVHAWGWSCICKGLRARDPAATSLRI